MLEETIDICTNTLSENLEKVEGLSRIEFKELLSLITKESYLIFNGKLYKQVEKNCLQNCPSDFKPHYYQQYVDDIFVLFTLPKQFEAFSNFLNGRHTNMSFTIELEKQNKMSFLVIEIICEDKTFTTSVYRKPIFSGVYTHFCSFLSSTHKFGTVYTLTYRRLQICSSWTKLHNKLVCLKKSFLKK